MAEPETAGQQTESHHIPAQSQQALLPHDTPALPSEVTSAETAGLDVQTKTRLIIICVIAVVIIVAVVATAVSVTFAGDTSTSQGPRWPTGDCGCSLFNSTFYYQWDEVCGEVTMEPVSENGCSEACISEYGEDNIWNIYYLRNTSECYCYTWETSDYCINITNTTDIRKWSYECCVYGRPYNIDSRQRDLKSSVQYVDCEKYSSYQDEQWKQFLSEKEHQNLSDFSTSEQWLNQALSEHASIATFSKFSLELMSIAAPLWMVQLSNEASLDEIRHTQISLDIANVYARHSNAECMTPGAFPPHELSINGDWNAISLDCAIGGCFGETLSAFKMMENEYDNVMDDMLYQMAVDEVRHSALAWSAVKWMIDRSNAADDHSLDVATRKWWKQRLAMMKRSTASEYESFVYQSVIPSLVNELWTEYEGRQFYEMAVQTLQRQLDMKRSQCFAVK